MKKLFLILQLMLASSLIFAVNENGNKKESKAVPAEAGVMVISGKVTDQMTGEALTGVKVTIDGTDVKVYTDFDGNFRIEKMLPGEYNLTATYVSYDKNQVQKFNPVKDGSHLEIELKSSL